MTRECGSCTLCCRIIGVNALNKPANIWCEHCDPRSGCQIYEGRPEECRVFMCLWLSDERLGDWARPDKTHVVLTKTIKGSFQPVCDPNHPMAWREGTMGRLLFQTSHQEIVNVAMGGTPYAVIKNGKAKRIDPSEISPRDPLSGSTQVKVKPDSAPDTPANPAVVRPLFGSPPSVAERCRSIPTGLHTLRPAQLRTHSAKRGSDNDEEKPLRKKTPTSEHDIGDWEKKSDGTI